MWMAIWNIIIRYGSKIILQPTHKTEPAFNVIKIVWLIYDK